ncbi:hypothetical protein KR054_000340, partial [Drosophila jambulina]
MTGIKDTTLAPSGQNLVSYEPCVSFTVEMPDILKEHRVGALIDERQIQRRLYYGIEVLPRTEENPVCLDFSRFLPFLPFFVSVAWLGRTSWNREPVQMVDSLQLCRHLATQIPVMPHLTVYRMSDKRLEKFLNLNFSNVLATRGDAVHPGQTYKYSKIIVDKAKARSGENISVCVGGFPEGYNKSVGVPPNLTVHLEILKEKVDAGADCIITQACYRAETIIKYVRQVRAAGITIPILVGVTAFETYKKFKSIERLQGARLDPHLYKKLVKLNNLFQSDPKAFPYLIRDFFVDLNVNIICTILKAGIEVYGFQIFTLNNFGATAELLKELK